MINVFSTTSHRSFFGNMKNALIAVIFGIVMIPAAVALMGWNEYRSVRRIRSLNDGLRVVQPNVDIKQQNPELEGSLIHFTEMATTTEQLKDELFGIEEVGIQLSRVVEMYQWKENTESKSRKKVGGGTETVTTYSYEKIWSEEIFDSANYDQPEFRNPAPKFSAQQWKASNVTAGTYRLSDSIIAQITDGEFISIDQALLDSLPEELQPQCVANGDSIYYSADGPNPAEAKVGDIRVKFEVVHPQKISVVTGVAGDSFQKYKTSNGQMLELVQPGEVSADEMFKIAQDENAMLTWFLRIFGFGLVATGISLVLGPLAVMMDVIPFVGSLARGGIMIVAMLGAVIISSFTISIAWIAVRPLVGIPMLLVGIAGIVALVMWRRKTMEATGESKVVDAEVELSAN